MTRAHRRGPWIPEEDAALMSLVQSQGPNNWVRISQHMHYRSPKQCRERFHQNLKPTLNHEPITSDEGEMIEQMVADMGKRWAEIARRLGNRSDNAVKNWWNGSMNRRRRNVIQSSSKTLSNRLEPLSAARPAITPISSDHYRRHSHSRSWSGSQPGMVNVAQAYYPQQYATQSMDYRPTLMTVNERRDQMLPSLGLPRPPSAPYGAAVFSGYTPPEVSSRLPNPFSQAARPPPMVLQPCPQRFIEPPMISPASSEISMPPALERAPSLISDNNSQSSISPKTTHSPRPNLPAPIDTRALNIRRSSTISLEASAQAYQSDEGYVSALPQSASTEGKHFSSHMPLAKMDERQSGSGRRWSPGHNYSHSASNPTLPPLMEQPLENGPKSARDTRMTFSSLLN